MLKFNNYNRSLSFLLFHLKEDRNISPNFIITDIPSHSFIDDLLYDTNLFQPNLFLSRTETRNRNHAIRSGNKQRLMRVLQIEFDFGGAEGGEKGGEEKSSENGGRG